jgi:hypothetical protein
MDSMRYQINVLITVVLLLSLFDACMAVVNYNTIQSGATVKDIDVNFQGETRWVEVMEGGSGGGGAYNFLKVTIVDNGYADGPHVTLSDEHGTVRQFNMVPEETAKILVMDKQGGSVLKTITVRDAQDNPLSDLLRILNSAITDLVELLSHLNINF